MIAKLTHTLNRPGFGLVENVVAMLIASVGVLALASVLAATAQQQSLTASRIELAAQAESKMDQLRSYAAARSADTLFLAVGGSVTSNVTNYFDNVTSPRGRPYGRRWQIVAGLNGTRTVTVRVWPTNRSRLELGNVDATSIMLIDR